jgi:hypothetical protein
VRRRSPTLLVLAIVAALLLHGALAAPGEAAAQSPHHAELVAHPASGAALALPGKRVPDLVRTARPSRTQLAPSTATFVRRPAWSATGARLDNVGPPRARSHASGAASRAPDDPLTAPNDV